MYVPSREQLVVEIYVRDLDKSISFYREMGFRLVRSEPHFAVMSWEKSALLLEQIEGQAPQPETVVANIRIMVPNVDDFWVLARKMGLQVLRPIANRYYGLRDFTVVSPDGVGLRFATRVRKNPHS